MAEKYHITNVRDSIPFGYGTEVDTPSVDISEEDLEATLRNLAWSCGCPVQNELITEAKQDGELRERGVRYAQINWWFTKIAQEINFRQKPRKYFPRITISRRVDEPVGEHEAESVPALYLTEMSPLNYPPFFALSRMAIEHASRMSRLYTISVIEDAISVTKTPIELVTTAAEYMMSPFDREQFMPSMLKQLLRQENLDEQGCYSIYRQLADNMKVQAPKLYGLYKEMSDSDKDKFGIIKEETLFNR